MDKKEMEEKALTLADTLTKEIISNCEPSEMGMVVTLILKNLHNMFESRITGSETNLSTDREDYAAFLGRCELPEIKSLD